MIELPPRIDLSGSDEAAEAPGLSINEIREIPPIGNLDGDGRSNGETIDEMFSKMFPSPEDGPPPASAVLVGIYHHKSIDNRCTYT